LTVDVEDSAVLLGNVMVEVENQGSEEMDIGPERLAPGETWESETHNLTVTDGLTYLANFLSGEDGRDVDYIAVGSDNSDTTLSMSGLQGTEHIRKQIPARDISHPTVEKTRYKFTLKSTEPGTQPVDIGEVGLFADNQGASSDFMFARATFDLKFEKNNDIEVRIFYEVRFKNP